jgi:spore maturation protein CgeB
MFKTLQRSQITLNHHGDIPPYANNFRLFEATGMKSALITDYKDNLKDYFIEGEEVLSYRDNEDCLAKIEILLNDEKLREEIAENGQKRTLADYNMFKIAEKTLKEIEEVLF